MKKIIIIDGGPRKTFNTAAMLQTNQYMQQKKTNKTKQ